MTNMVEHFAVQLTPPESQILADVRNFVDWQTQSQNQMFVPRTVDDVAIRSTDGYRKGSHNCLDKCWILYTNEFSCQQKSRFL